MNLTIWNVPISEDLLQAWPRLSYCRLEVIKKYNPAPAPKVPTVWLERKSNIKKELGKFPGEDSSTDPWKRQKERDMGWRGGTNFVGENINEIVND